jgi:hypothetical protein
MVHIREEGSRFDASIETVWRFLNSPAAHDRAHKLSRNRHVQDVGELSMLESYERNWRGDWVKVANRLTVLPPLGTVTEFKEGPFAGSRMFTVYTPESGEATRIDVYGEFKSPSIPPDQVEAAARSWLSDLYNEDAPALRLLQTGQLDASATGLELEKMDTKVEVTPVASDVASKQPEGAEPEKT